VRHIVASALILGGLGGCASHDPALASFPSSSIGSGYSSGRTDQVADSTGVGMTREPDAGLVARPDMLVMDARIVKEDVDAGRALAQAQAMATDLVARLQQVTAGAATLIPCGTQVTPLGPRGKTVSPPETFRVQLEGRVEVALAADADYWKRSALVVALAQLADGYARAREDKTKAGGDLTWIGNSRVMVKNAESYRAKLTDQWVQRAQAFAAAAQAREAPLHLLDCTPPGEIVQRQRSLEEVALSLSVNCRLGSLKQAAAVPVPAAR
jgi:hypothetical protein